jgi:hypothetical protein
MTEMRTLKADFPISKSLADSIVVADIGEGLFCYKWEDKLGEEYNPEGRSPSEAVLIVKLEATNNIWKYYFVNPCNQFKKADTCAI